MPVPQDRGIGAAYADLERFPVDVIALEGANKYAPPIPPNRPLIVAQRWIVVALCILLTGCVPICRNAKRTFWDEPRAFSWKKDRQYSKEVYHGWAEKAWREQSSSIPEVHRKGDYGAGFKEGFVEYVYAGGTGEPPPVPPRRYWNTDLRSPRGHGAADQWFAGYRHGASIAREGGYREQATLRSSLRMESVSEVALPQYYDAPLLDTPSVEQPRFPTESLPTEALPLELPLEIPKIELPARSAANRIKSTSTHFIERADFLFTHEAPEENVPKTAPKRDRPRLRSRSEHSGNERHFPRPTKYQKPVSVSQTTEGEQTIRPATTLSRRTIAASEPEPIMPEPRIPEPKNSTIRMVSSSLPEPERARSSPPKLKEALTPSRRVSPLETPTETGTTIQEESAHHFVF